MTMILASSVCLAAATLAGWISAPSVSVARERQHRGSLLVAGSWMLSIAGSVCAVAAGIAGVEGDRNRLALHFFADAALRVDRLAGLFLIIVFGAAIPTLLAGAALTRDGRARINSAVSFALLSVFVIVTADNLFLLLAGWESLGFAFYLLAGFDRELDDRARTSVVTALFSKMSGAAILVGGLLLAAGSHGFALSALSPGDGPAEGFAYALLVFGFGVKVGLVPFHVWLPDSYACAPGAARAIMAGVAVNAGFYGLWRTLDLLGAPPIWLACVVLVLAGITAILGISHSAVHADMRHLIAWSSVENAGLIVAGYGIAMVGVIIRNDDLAAAGLLAATAQVITHALGKSLLFITCGAIERATGSTDLDELRGIAHRLRISGTGMVVGALTLAGLPLTAGFASEWLTLEALMQQFRVHDLILQLCLATAGVLVALTIGVAGITFVRLVGLTVFGHPTTSAHGPRADNDRVIESSLLYRSGVALLVAGCLGAAMFAVPETDLIVAGVRHITGSFSARAGRFILQPVFANFSALSPTLLWIVIPGLAVVIGAGAALYTRGRIFRVRRVRAWQSASPGVEGRFGYTSFAFANPIRKVLSHLLLTRSELRSEAVQLPDADYGDARDTAAVQLGYTVDVVEIVDKYIYHPLVSCLRVVVRVAKRLQSGRLDAYIAYMLVAVVAVVAVVTAIVNQ